MIRTKGNRCRGPKRQLSKGGGRRGAATVELAACLPLLVLLIFGSIQACDLIYLKHSVVSAAYEGTIELIRPNSTNASVKTRVEQVLDMYGLKGSEVKLSPGAINDIPPGTPVRILVRADVDENLAIAGWFPTPKSIEHTAVGPR